MLENHYSYSKALKRLSLAVGLAVSLSACSASTSSNQNLRLAVGAKPGNSVSAKASSEAQIRKRTAEIDFQKTGSVSAKKATENANCRFLKNSAEAEATVIASPTLEATSDEEGSGSVSLNMNLFDFKKAELVKSSADAKCAYHLASKQIDGTLSYAKQSTQQARNDAKYRFLQSQLSELNQINRSAITKMQNGLMTRQDANQVQAAIGQIKAEMQLAKAEANKAKDLPPLDRNAIKQGHTNLVLAGQRLQQIERDIRTNDALELTLGAGYRYNERNTGINTSSFEDDAFAKVTLGVRLGAFSKRRIMAEEAAESARMDTLFEQNTGAIWRTEITKRSIDRLITDLGRTETELNKAEQKPHDTIMALGSVGVSRNPVLELQARLQKISIGAQLAETRAAIAQLRKNREDIANLSAN